MTHLQNPVYQKTRPPGNIREKILDGYITFQYMPRTGQIKMWEKIRTIPHSVLKPLYVWDDPPGELGEWLSYLERVPGRKYKESVVDRVIELLKKHLPEGIVSYDTNPVYPKERGPGFHVGDRIIVVGDVRDKGRRGKIIAPRAVIGGIPSEGYSTVEFDEGDKGYFSIRSLQKIGYGENPVYPKHRFSSKFKIGDRVTTTNLAGGRNKTGRVYKIHPPDNISDEHSYDIELPGGAWSQHYESSLMLAPEDNPIYQKRRYGNVVKIIDPPELAGLIGTIMDVDSNGTDDENFKVLTDDGREFWLFRYQFEGLGEGGMIPNPIYSKKRGDPKEIKVGDQVTVTDGHAAGSSGEVISTFVLPMPGYITIRTMSGKTYAVKLTHVIRTHTRYRNNQPRRWGVWPAEDPPVGEVVIDSHPTSERHGTTAVVVKWGKSTSGEGIYLLKFRDGFERWYTSLQIRRMPSKLGWKAMQENPIFPKKRWYQRFKIGQRVLVTVDWSPFYGESGIVSRIREREKDYMVTFHSGARASFSDSDLEVVETDRMLENPIYPKRRGEWGGRDLLNEGDRVQFVKGDYRTFGRQGTIVDVRDARYINGTMIYTVKFEGIRKPWIVVESLEFKPNLKRID